MLTEQEKSGEWTIIEAYATENGVQLWFPCPWCPNRHFHGRCGSSENCKHVPTNRSSCTCPIGSGDGHRGSHCIADGAPTSYVIKEFQP